MPLTSNEVIALLLGNLIRESIVELDAPGDPDRINKDHPLITYIRGELSRRLIQLGEEEAKGLQVKIRVLLENDFEGLKASIKELVYKFYRSKVFAEGPPDRFREPGGRARWAL
ncbi:MAG: hypothetical protein QXO32_01425 [Candidatus Bathyarchaeia archaeon]